MRGNPEPGRGKAIHLTLCKVGRGSRRLSCLISCQNQDQLQQAALDHDQLGGKYLQRCRLQMSPCSLFHYLISLTIKETIFLTFKWNFLYFSLCLLCPFIKSLVHFVLHTLIWYLYTLIRSPLSLRVFRLWALHLSVANPPYPCSIFMNLCFIFSSMSMSLL